MIFYYVHNEPQDDLFKSKSAYQQFANVKDEISKIENTPTVEKPCVECCIQEWEKKISELQKYISNT